VADGNVLVVVQALAMAIACIEIALNLTHKKTLSGRKLSTLREIVRQYAGGQLWVDVVNLCALSLAMATGIFAFSCLRLVAVSKVGQVMEKLERLEIYLIENYYNEQYWSLAKTLIFNFCFAHMLAILLLAMTSVDPERNWMVAKQVHLAPWI
jgi:hypothetical protein